MNSSDDDAELARLKKLWDEEFNPPVRPMCSRMNLMESGNRMVHVFPFCNIRDDYIPAAAVSVYRLSFIPDKSEDLHVLCSHVRNALRSLADIQSEFYEHHDYAPCDSRYYRPKRNTGNEHQIENAYVYSDNGEVIIAAPLILSDAVHVYSLLKEVLIPSKETALQFEQARWNELRGPLSSSDVTLSVLERDYSFEAMPMDQQLGCLHNADANQAVSEALRHMITMRVADITTDEELITQLTGLSYSTAKGLLEDKSGHYPALPPPQAGRSLQDIQAEEKAAILQRANDMLKDALGETGADTNESAGESLNQLRDSMGHILQEKLNDPHYNPYQRHQQAAWEDTRENRWGKDTQVDWKKKWNAHLQAAEAEHASRKNAISDVRDSNYKAQEVPFFLPRRHVWRDFNFDGSIRREAEYQSRPPGPAWPPLVDLPANLKPFIDYKSEHAPAQNRCRALGWNLS